VTDDTTLAVLRRFHREKLDLRQRHVAVARHVADYAANNAYQYVVAREDVHLQWLEAAIVELGGTPDDAPEPDVPAPGRNQRFTYLVEEDVRGLAGFVDRWREPVAGISDVHTRHRQMAKVVLGEVREHKRFFEQIVAGRQDVLGRRANGPGPSGTSGRVLPVRWME
jgi:hypothetical protein